MTNEAFGQFMKAVGAYPKLNFLGEKKELIYVTAELIERIDQTNKSKPALKIIVRDRSDGDIKQWITESIVVADTLRKIEPKMAFTVQPIKRGAKNGYKIEILGLVEDKGNEPLDNTK